MPNMRRDYRTDDILQIVWLHADLKCVSGVVHSEMPGEAMTRGLQVGIFTLLVMSTHRPGHVHVPSLCQCVISHSSAENTFKVWPSSRLVTGWVRTTPIWSHSVQNIV